MSRWSILGEANDTKKDRKNRNVPAGRCPCGEWDGAGSVRGGAGRGGGEGSVGVAVMLRGGEGRPGAGEQEVGRGGSKQWILRGGVNPGRDRTNRVGAGAGPEGWIEGVDRIGGVGRGGMARCRGPAEGAFGTVRPDGLPFPAASGRHSNDCISISLA